MTGEPLVDGLLFAAVIASATIVSSAEYAIDAMPRSRLEFLADEGREGAERALRLKEKTEELRAAAHISNTFLLVLAAAIVSPYVQRLVLLFASALHVEWLIPSISVVTGLLSAMLMAGVFVVLIGLVASSLGTRFADSLALQLSGMLTSLTRFFRMPRRILTSVANLLLRPFGATARFSEPVISEANLMDILEEGTKSGILDQTEHDLIESIFQFTDTTAGEIMVPRKDIVAIDYAMSPSEILDEVLQEGFTRMPVYKGTIDNIIGIVYAKDVISLVEHSHIIILDDIIRPVFFVPETKRISELLRDFQRKRIHLAVVVDEFGGTEGILTLEDIIEEIVGDIRDEYDEELQAFDVLADGVIETEASINITDLNEEADLSIPESDEYDTVGGFVTRQLGKIPEPGEVVEAHGLLIEVLAVDERRIKRVRITRTLRRRTE